MVVLALATPGTREAQAALAHTLALTPALALALAPEAPHTPECPDLGSPVAAPLVPWARVAPRTRESRVALVIREEEEEEEVEVLAAVPKSRALEAPAIRYPIPTAEAAREVAVEGPAKVPPPRAGAEAPAGAATLPPRAVEETEATAVGAVEYP